jgi:hypothetical protein
MHLIFPFLLLAAAQSDKLPPANPLPLAASEEGQVMAPITTLFDGLAKRDSTIVLTAMRPDGTATATSEKPDGTRTIRRMTATEFAAGIKPGPEGFEERLTDPAIEIDGDIAMVWSPYVFLIDGKVHHCGVDHFDLIRENGSWKVSSISWSSRTTGCPAQ